MKTKIPIAYEKMISYLLSSFKKMRFIYILFLLLFFTNLQAQFQIPVFSSLVSDDLLDEVVDEYKTDSVLEYGPARDLMYSIIDNENDSVSCIYTGHTLYLPEGVDPSVHLYMNGSNNGINCEHTYPRSKGAAEENGNPFSDMHHLFPSRTAVNSTRSNFPFQELNDNETTTWFYLNQSQNSIPTTNIDAYSESIDGGFEPREQSKGNIARAAFYFFAMYKDEALEADPDFFELQRETLCDWHSQDPVDSIEWERTHKIAEYQDGFPNPFVLDSTLVLRAFCGAAATTATHELIESEILISPNPVVDLVSVTLEGKNNLQVIDVLGRILIKKEFWDTIELDLSTMNSGTYFITINEKIFRVMKR